MSGSRGKASAHGRPLGEENVKALQSLGWEKSHSPCQAIYRQYEGLAKRGAKGDPRGVALRFAEYQERVDMKKLWDISCRT